MKQLSELFKICDDPNGYQEVGRSVNYKFQEEGDCLTIYFQGSNSTWDWIRNFMFGKRPYKDMSIPYRVHRGFLAAWKEVEDIIIEKITETVDGSYKWKDITVVGYSHGGALCQFAVECVWYHRADLRCGQMRGYAFEAPRIFAQWRLPQALKERWGSRFVFRDGTDIVTHCPPILFGYRNLGTMQKIKGDYHLVDKKWLPRCVKYHYQQVVYDGLVKFEGGISRDE